MTSPGLHVELHAPEGDFDRLQMDEPETLNSLGHDLSIGWPDERFYVNRGDLDPQVVKIGNPGSSLIAALAVAVNSVRNGRDAQRLYRDLSSSDYETGTRADARGSLEHRLRTVRGFKIPLLNEVAISPLISGAPSAVWRNQPIGLTSEAVSKGSAVLFPLPKPKGTPEIPQGRTFWGVVTGSSRESATPVADHLQPQDLEFVVAIPQPKRAMLTPVNAADLAIALGSGEYARIIRSTV